METAANELDYVVADDIGSGISAASLPLCGVFLGCYLHLEPGEP